jgi:hypothetical protein
MSDDKISPTQGADMSQFAVPDVSSASTQVKRVNIDDLTQSAK